MAEYGFQPVVFLEESLGCYKSGFTGVFFKIAAPGNVDRNTGVIFLYERTVHLKITFNVYALEIHSANSEGVQLQKMAEGTEKPVRKDSKAVGSQPCRLHIL